MLLSTLPPGGTPPLLAELSAVVVAFLTASSPPPPGAAVTTVVLLLLPPSRPSRASCASCSLFSFLYFMVFGGAPSARSSLTYLRVRRVRACQEGGRGVDGIQYDTRVTALLLRARAFSNAVCRRFAFIHEKGRRESVPVRRHEKEDVNTHRRRGAGGQRAMCPARGAAVGGVRGRERFAFLEGWKQRNYGRLKYFYKTVLVGAWRASFNFVSPLGQDKTNDVSDNS